MMPASVYKLHIFDYLFLSTCAVTRALWVSVRCIQTNTNGLRDIVFAHRDLNLYENKLTSIAAGVFVNLPKLE